MNTRRLALVLQFVGIGWYVAICIIAGGAGGLWLDKRLGSTPAFTLTGIALGLAVAGVGMYRMLMAVLEGMSPDRNQPPEGDT